MPVLLRYKDQDIIDGLDQNINPSLYGHYSASFRRAVDVTFKQDSDSGLSDRLRANAARFAAHKAAYVQRTLQNIQADPQIEDKPKACKQALRVFDNWQDAEYNTAVARARTAKQFEEFNDPESLRLFPNLRWVPSRSANPRAAHQVFYDRVWAKNDPFWANHSPGTEWNCKCDIEETDAPVTENQDMQLPKAPRGLEGNPYETGELFSDNASYVVKTRSMESEISNFTNGYSLKYWRENEDLHQQLRNTTATCTIEGRQESVTFGNDQIDEALYSFIGHPVYVLKNECLHRLPQILKEAKYIGWKEVDKTHNKPKSKAAKFKSHGERFEYFQTTLPDGSDLFIHTCLMENGQRRFYTVTMEMKWEGLHQ